jgi:FkbM family methyltransferase
MNTGQSQALWRRKPAKLWVYTKDGTVFRRFYRWLNEQKGLRERWWDLRAATQSMLAYKLETGAKLSLYSDDQFSKAIFVQRFEADERDFICRYLAAGDIFVDVGANIGLFTLLGAGVVGPHGKVYALEPTTTTYERLVHNVTQNHLKNVTCFQVALSDQDEERMLTISTEGLAAWNSLAHPCVGTHFAQEQIRCYQWDTFVTEHDLTGRVTLMKIDIEGWEFYMLQGAQVTLRRADAPDLLVEFTEVNANAAGVTGAAVYELLETFGYRLYRIVPKQKSLYPAIEKEYGYENLVATKRIEQVCRRTGYKVVLPPKV